MISIGREDHHPFHAGGVDGFHIAGTSVIFFFIHFPDAFGFIHNAAVGIVCGKDFNSALGIPQEVIHNTSGTGATCDYCNTDFFDF